MLCQNCGKNDAVTHIKQIINGEMDEVHLCRDCARHLGYDDIFSGFDFDFGGFFGSLLGDMISPRLIGETERCEKCGCSFNDILRSGKAGCSECYTKFYDKLIPSIKRIHGQASHTGKVGSGAVRREKTESAGEKIEQLRAEMNQAVSVQNFEKAALLRDEIKALEGGESK
jgi:protein arginine kinase activator